VNYAVEFGNVSLVRGGARILDNITISIPIGESVAVIGPNGSGKTSLMRLLKGDARPYYDETGTTTCRLFGQERWNIFDLRKKMGVVSTDLQSRFDGSVSVGAVILSGFFRTMDVYKDHKITDGMVAAAEDAAARVGISDKITRDIGKLSLGEMRRTLIARALVPKPEMLLLDEPMTGLDVVIMNQFRTMFDSLIESGTGIVMITHDLGDIPKNIRRVIMMKDGKIFGDGKKDDMLTSENVSALFSSPIKVTEENGTYRMGML
jgi:iron complex transport system ATP-binding protein